MRKLIFLANLIPALLVTSALGAQTYPAPKSSTNNSITIDTGNTFKQILPDLAPGVSRQSLTIENNNTNNDLCWINVTGDTSPAKASSMLLVPGGSYTRYYPYIPANKIFGTCTTTGDSIYADQQ